MKTRTIALLAILGILAVALGAWGIPVLQDIQENAREREMWARTPVLGFGFEREVPGSQRYCMYLDGISDEDDAETLPLRWEQFYVHEYRPEGPRDYSLPGLSGEVKVGQRSCGFEENGYYDVVYRPTGYPAYFKYDGCGGNPEARSESQTHCFPPRNWPR